MGKNQGLCECFLAVKRSKNTKEAYRKDLEDFSRTIKPQSSVETSIAEFIKLNREQAVTAVYHYKTVLIERGLAEATINRRLSTLRSLVTFANGVGACEWSLESIRGEKVVAYRDTSGISVDKVLEMLQVPDRTTLAGKRDYAILRLLWDNALRRGEIVKTQIGEFDYEAATLFIQGKGKGTQKEKISLSHKTAQAIMEWLNARKETNLNQPLFIALNPSYRGRRLTGNSIALIVKKTAAKVGIKKKMSPHRMRHSAITAALEATNGNVVMVQKLSRHTRVETLLVYNDNRVNEQKHVTEILSGMC